MAMTQLDQVLTEGIEDEDMRERAARYVTFLLNTERDWRPSDAARIVVSLHKQGFLIGRIEEHDAAMEEWHNRNG